jgi:hypothetical protein
MKNTNVMLLLFITSISFSCKKKTTENEAVPLQNLRIAKDARYTYHYDGNGRIISQDLLINDVMTKYWDYSYNSAGKIESRVQLAREYSSDELKNQYFYYDANNRLEKVVKRRQGMTGSAYLTDSICLHYDNNENLSYGLNYKDSYVDSAVYSNFYKGVPQLIMTYTRPKASSVYSLNEKKESEYDQYDNLLKTTKESFDPRSLSKRETVSSYEFYSEQIALILKNTKSKSHYFSFEMSIWIDDNGESATHHQKTRKLTDYTRNCTEDFDFTLEYDANGFIQKGTSVGVSSCYQGNNFNETYNFKDYIVYESL